MRVDAPQQHHQQEEEVVKDPGRRLTPQARESKEAEIEQFIGRQDVERRCRLIEDGPKAQEQAVVVRHGHHVS